MMEKSTSAYDDFVEATKEDLAERLKSGEITQEEYDKTMASVEAG